MHFLANENFPGDAVLALRVLGHDVAWVRTDAPGSTDPDVLTRAERKRPLYFRVIRGQASPSPHRMGSGPG